MSLKLDTNQALLDDAIAVLNACADPDTRFTVQHQRRRLVLLVRRNGRVTAALEICTFPEAQEDTDEQATR